MPRSSRGFGATRRNSGFLHLTAERIEIVWSCLQVSPEEKLSRERALMPHRHVSFSSRSLLSLPEDRDSLDYGLTTWRPDVRILDGLALDGIAPANSPHELTPADANGASKVLAFDAVPVEQRGNANVTYWSGVPLGINEYEAARDEIVRRIDELIPTLTADKRTSCRQGRS